MKKGIIVLLAATLGLAACNREKKGAGGLLYTIHHSDGKEKIKEGDIVKLNFIQKNQKDSVLANTYDNEMPQVFPVAKKMYAGDMNDVLTMFGEGDSATFKIDLDTMAFYSKQPKPEQFKNDKYLVFTVKVEKVFKKDAKEADSTFRKRAGEFFQKDYQESIAKKKGAEEGKIKAYVADNNLKTTTTPSGLQYIISAPGNAERVVEGDTATVNYTGSLTKKDAKGKYPIFDTSDEKLAKAENKFQPGRPYGPTKMAVGGTIPGFTEALKLIGKGGKIKVIIPSKLGYGEQGAMQAGIMPYSPIVFDLEITDIKKGTAPQPAVLPATK
ncbi:FKBP-type peptidyl-prolyl cis-trans isomerase [Pedobacter rhizosphaerae]|uniref:peptidylprolyl isomerase n=1 Tax=Pedobacter rhizosphaerae TaxID=390241 RepID=A0A1H9VNI4_9SPHI|nr:FKBP-type peptidyl-prolyl cis-trans isomerase [Pedobacter rhizosphaerae]SES22763.1 FKBP-type peptidyl-prolyl cis-trans isomerase [Pedobacter rhizosphaerae]